MGKLAPYRKSIMAAITAAGVTAGIVLNGHVDAAGAAAIAAAWAGVVAVFGVANNSTPPAAAG